MAIQVVHTRKLEYRLIAQIEDGTQITAEFSGGPLARRIGDRARSGLAVQFDFGIRLVPVFVPDQRRDQIAGHLAVAAIPGSLLVTDEIGHSLRQAHRVLTYPAQGVRVRNVGGQPLAEVGPDHRDVDLRGRLLGGGRVLRSELAVRNVSTRFQLREHGNRQLRHCVHYCVPDGGGVVHPRRADREFRAIHRLIELIA